MTMGRLFGVGVGPGDPGLVTFKAVKVLRGVDLLLVPRATDYSPSTAWSIVGDHVGSVPGQVRKSLTFPMSYDPERMLPAWAEASRVCCEALLAGRDVGFVVEGDPSLFSSFYYLRRMVEAELDGVEVELVPGVSSIQAVAAVLGNPLADGQQRVAIVPGAYGLDDLDELLDRFDTVLIMKMGPSLPRIIECLRRREALHLASYVSRATMARQKVVRGLDGLEGVRGDCFAMCMIHRSDRSGILLGEQPPVPGLVAPMDAASGGARSSFGDEHAK